MIELEVDGSKMILNDDNTIVVDKKMQEQLGEDVVNSDNMPSFVTIKDIN